VTRLFAEKIAHLASANRTERIIWSELPDFLRTTYQNGKKINQMTLKFSKWPKSIANCRIIDRMAIKYTTSSFVNPSKIYPNWDFWFEKMPPGNPNLVKRKHNIWATYMGN
jgi:hypothetical protein